MRSSPLPFRRPRLRRALTSAATGLGVIAGMLVAGTTGGGVAAASPNPAPSADNKIAADLNSEFERSAGAPQDFWVSFEQTADTSGAREIDDWTERGQYVVDRLKETARESQADTIALLDAAGVDHTTFWISNAIRIEAGDYGLARQLAAEPAVERVFAPVQYEKPDPIDQRLVDSRLGPNAEATVEWGVQNIKADQVWETYGVRGDGIVIANIDTGVQFDHPALANSYRGNNGDGTFDNDYNWFDATGASDFPIDGHGHGTHTMGTMVGDDGGANQVGVAPGVTWIAANGCATCATEDLIASAQWMLAPTRVDGSDPNPAMRPNIINNSWGSKTPTNDPLMPDVLAAWADAGIFGVWANGNNGSGCATSGSPGSRTLNYSVGAYDSTNTIAGFSSRGPGQDGETKPNVSAPGVDVRSSYPGNRYAVLNGTSMAAPHAAGAIALLWSADPSLIGDIGATRALLDGTAIDTADDQCGGTTDDNNVYGEGRLEALALVEATNPGGTGTIAGTVTHDETGDPVGGVAIRLSAGDLLRSTRTGDDGAYSAHVPAGDYQATVSAFGYETITVPISVTAGRTTTTDIALTAAPGFSVSGTVVDERSGRPIPGTTVTVAGSRFSATTDNAGSFAVEGIPGPQRYLITIDPPGACSKTLRRSVLVNEDISMSVLKPARNTDQPSFGWGAPYGFSCVVEPTEWIAGDTPVEMPSHAFDHVELDLPFPFTYFGKRFDTILVNTAGTATFDADIGHSAVLDVFTQGILPPEALLTRVTGTAPNRAFTVEWRDLSWVEVPGTVSVELTLHENGDIVYAYKDLDPTKPWQLGSQARVGLTDSSPNGRAANRVHLVYSDSAPVLSSDRQIRFELPPNGFVAGHVTDKATGEPVANASVELYNQYGTRLMRTTTDADGDYWLQLMTGQRYSIGVIKAPAYETPSPTPIELTKDREVRQLTTTLHSGRIQLSDDTITLRQGHTEKIRLTNRGDRQLTWWATTHEAGSTPPPGSALDAVDVSDAFPLPAYLSSLAYVDDNTWWAGSVPAAVVELDRGHLTGAEIDLGSVARQLGLPSDRILWPKATAWLPGRGWQCLFPSFQAADTIACIDPETSQVRAKIPTGYTNEEPTGLAYDPDRDLFYMTIVDGYQTRLRTLDGPYHPEPGTVRNTCVLPDDTQELSYNPTTRTLWTMTLQGFAKPETQTGFLRIEPEHCHATADPRLDRSRGFLGDLDEDGNLLVRSSNFAPITISTVQTPDPTADTIPWLHVSTDSGTLAKNRSQGIEISVDWNAVPEGVTGAKLVFRGNGGANSTVTVPIELAQTRSGTSGPDWIDGTDGPENVLALDGDDVVLGGGGEDQIVGGRGDDILSGDLDDDVINGGSGADVILGGPGADILTPGYGADIVYAGAGNDTVKLRRDGDRDTIVCGPGRDKVVYLGQRDPHDVLQGCENVVTRAIPATSPTAAKLW